MSDELKPCPFCGREVNLTHDDDGCPFVGCHYCDFTLPAYIHGFEVNAIAAWNRRATSGAASGEVPPICPECRDRPRFKSNWLNIFDDAPAEQSAPPVGDQCIYTESATPSEYLASLPVEDLGDVIREHGMRRDSAPPVPRMGGDTIKPWRERVRSTYGENLSNSTYRDVGWSYAMAEITELRALLTTQSASTAYTSSHAPASAFFWKPDYDGLLAALDAPKSASTAPEPKRYDWTRDGMRECSDGRYQRHCQPSALDGTAPGQADTERDVTLPGTFTSADDLFEAMGVDDKAIAALSKEKS